MLTRRLLITNTALSAGVACFTKPNCGPVKDSACKFNPVDVPTANMDKWDLWKPDSEGHPRLRGANIFQRTMASDSSPHWCSELNEEFFRQLREAGANYVNLSVPGTYNVQPSIPVDPTKPKYAEIKAFADRLETLICWAKKAQLWVVISFRSGPGRSESDIVPEEGAEVVRRLFVSDDAKTAFAEMWETIALRYQNHPNVAGYDLLVEPHKPKDFQGEKFDFDQFRERWRQIATNTITRIRSVDAKTPILVNLDEDSSAEAIVNWEPLFPCDTNNAHRIVTAVHQYMPYAYTHNDAASGCTSFDPCAKELTKAFGRISDWRQKNPNLPVAVNEYGLKPSRPESFRFLQEEIKQMETQGLNHAVWLWDDTLGDCYNDEMDVFFKPMGELSEFSRVLHDAWNQVNPILPPTATWRQRDSKQQFLDFDANSFWKSAACRTSLWSVRGILTISRGSPIDEPSRPQNIPDNCHRRCCQEIAATGRNKPLFLKLDSYRTRSRPAAIDCENSTVRGLL